MTDIDALIKRLNALTDADLGIVEQAASALAEQRDVIARLKEQVAELEISAIIAAEVDRICDDERDALRARVADYEDDYNAVANEQCAQDEKHCTCVAPMRRRIKDLVEAEAARFRLATEWAETARKLRDDRDSLLRHARTMAASLEADGHCDDTRSGGCCHCEAVAAFRAWEAEHGKAKE